MKPFLCPFPSAMRAARPPVAIAGANGFARLATAGCALLLAALPAAAQALSTDSLAKVSVRAVAHFQSGRSVVLPADQKRLLAEVAARKDVSWQSVTAVGHADSIGTDETNQRLSARRAEAVKAYLVGKGLEAAMIRTEARGENDPVADNETPEGRGRNRRTEVVFEGVRVASR